MSNSYVILLVTTSSKQEAETIAQELLEAKLIACANILGPVTSHFHWVGKIEKTEEYLVLMKSREDLFDQVAERVRALHSYDVPEILALPVVKGSRTYLDWLGSVLK
ncbi:MAG: divalent-cation tolerance protein CutA [Candidatus Bathyarchaeia archaeon]